jgi:hypothetical protein
MAKTKGMKGKKPTEAQMPDATAGATQEKKKDSIKDAAAVVAAAAVLATTVIATAATDATKTLASAASDATTTVAGAAADATKMLTHSAAAATLTVMKAAENAALQVQEAAVKTLAELPDIKEDIREIRSKQDTLVSSVSEMVKDAIHEHTTYEATWQTATTTSLTEIKGHMQKQNGRLAKAENHITRQNVAIFGVAGPVALVILGIVGRPLVTMVIAAEKSGTLVNWPNIILGGSIGAAVLVAVAVYIGYKINQLLHRHVELEDHVKELKELNVKELSVLAPQETK